MNVSLDLGSIIKSLSSFLQRFHAILFFLLVGAGIMICLITIISIINLSSQSDASSQTITSGFDNSTIDKINKLESRTDNTPIDIPTNQRINPFSD